VKLFLAKGEISRRPYEGESEEIKDTQLVWAETWEEAKAKYKAYWDDRNSSYSVSYWVNWVDLDEALT
jgi:hypothetical protein